MEKGWVETLCFCAHLVWKRRLLRRPYAPQTVCGIPYPHGLPGAAPNVGRCDVACAETRPSFFPKMRQRRYLRARPFRTIPMVKAPVPPVSTLMRTRNPLAASPAKTAAARSRRTTVFLLLKRRPRRACRRRSRTMTRALQPRHIINNRQHLKVRRLAGVRSWPHRRFFLLHFQSTLGVWWLFF